MKALLLGTLRPLYSHTNFVRESLTRPAQAMIHPQKRPEFISRTDLPSDSPRSGLQHVSVWQVAPWLCGLDHDTHKEGVRLLLWHVRGQ